MTLNVLTRGANHVIKSPERPRLRSSFICLTKDSFKVPLTKQGKLVFGHAAYFYPYSRAQSPRRLFKYVKQLKAALTRNPHLDRPKVHTPDGASKIYVKFPW